MLGIGLWDVIGKVLMSVCANRVFHPQRRGRMANVFLSHFEICRIELILMMLGCIIMLLIVGAMTPCLGGRGKKMG